MNVKVAYFSGTGGTKRIAESCAHEFEQRGNLVDLECIGASACHADACDSYEFLVLVSVVHEFNLPFPVRAWVSSLDHTRFAKAAVLSVSGGGSAVGNRGAQKPTIDVLETSGVPVVFDEIFVLPSNFFYRIKHPVDAMLMTAYPVKVKYAVERILAGETQRPKTPLLDRFVTRCFKNSWKHTHKFGSAIITTQECTGCGLCVQVCPVSNITLDQETKRPVFSNNCVFCLACLYACPAGALKAERSSYALIKDGYNLVEIEQRHYDPEAWETIETLCKGYLYSGVKKYLLEARMHLDKELGQKSEETCVDG